MDCFPGPPGGRTTAFVAVLEEIIDTNLQMKVKFVLPAVIRTEYTYYS